MNASEKFYQYGINACSLDELLNLAKWKKKPEDFYKSPQFLAVKELIRRYELPEKINISSSRKAYEMLSFLETEEVEKFYVIFMNRRHNVIAQEFIGQGSPVATVVDIQKIFMRALTHRAQGIIICHNHPSGDPSPSEADIKLTQKINEAGKLLDINVIDHLIVSNKKYYSFADEGLL